MTRMARSGLVVVLAGAASLAHAAETKTYKYDTQGRLVEVKSTGNAAARTTKYTYDKAHNRIRATTTRP